ncbi:uncharacterized protein [Anser cygnoides]|uniref:uncharacterized protein isoform X2 n=1 Tax=Anser cygnoides TaxID=8845 RepID=UPI0034D1EDC8
MLVSDAVEIQLDTSADLPADLETMNARCSGSEGPRVCKCAHSAAPTEWHCSLCEQLRDVLSAAEQVTCWPHTWLVTNDLFATIRRTKPLTEERMEAITSALSTKQYFNFCHQSGEAEVASVRGLSRLKRPFSCKSPWDLHGYDFFAPK